MRVMGFALPESGARVKVEIGGDVGGNSQSMAVEVVGGQFEFAEAEKIEDGIRFEVIGTWEAQELCDIMAKVGMALSG